MDTFVFSETLNQWQTHSGVDFLTAEAADVFAALEGTVSMVITDDILNGNTVVVDHGNGLLSYYMSLSSEIPVAVGDKVTTSTKLGMTSLSAYSEFKEGPHLHFEMTKDGELLNPNDYFKSNK